MFEAGQLYMRAGLAALALSGKSPNGRYHRPGMEPAWGPFTDPDDPRWAKAAAHRSTSGVGIVLAYPLCCVDVDGEEGAATFMSLVGHVPVTAVALTGREGGGLHLYFVSPNPVRNGKLAEKLDIKAEGGYLVAPPSTHPDSGKAYTWLAPLVQNLRGEPVVHVDWLPDAIEELLAAREAVAEVPLAGDFRGGSIDGLVKHMASAPEGSRNNTLNGCAWTARQDGFPFSEAVGPLAAAAVAAGLEKDEAVRTIKSAYAERAR